MTNHKFDWTDLIGLLISLAFLFIVVAAGIVGVWSVVNGSAPDAQEVSQAAEPIKVYVVNLPGMDGMPCENYEGRISDELSADEKALEESDEGGTRKEENHETLPASGGSEGYAAYSDVMEIVRRNEEENGLYLPDAISEYLKNELAAAEIDWWYPFAAAQIWAESSCNAAAESKDGMDKGLLQYRLKHWPHTCWEYGLPEDTSIFDWKAQISIYVKQTAERLESGRSINETISAHKWSNWGPYDEAYVDYVLSLVRIPNSHDWDAAYDARVYQ